MIAHCTCTTFLHTFRLGLQVMKTKDYEIVVFDVTRNPEVFVALLDEKHEPPSDFQVLDPNFLGNFTFGSIKNHHVMIASTMAPGCQRVPAARLAALLEDKMHTYSIVLGTAGGTFDKLSKDIRLGDVVISKPKGQHGGVVEWDVGTEQEDGSFKRTGFLDRVPTRLSSLRSKLRSDIEFGSVQLMVENAVYPGAESDLLFDTACQHVGGDSCGKCGPNKIQREQREDCGPRVHFGGVASGETLMVDGVMRDHLAKILKVKCFGMDAAKVMAIRPSLCIMGVGNYADSHQQSLEYGIWEEYAAAAAATYTKHFVMQLRFLR
jgi:nucleoside phosphorylase